MFDTLDDASIIRRLKLALCFSMTYGQLIGLGLNDKGNSLGWKHEYEKKSFNQAFAGEKV